MTAKQQLLELLALPYNPARDLEPFFDALKAYCNDPASRADPDRPRLHRATYALHDVRSEPPLTAEERRNMGTPREDACFSSYPFNALPADWFRRA
jgi:hypothetical protein